MIKNSSKNGFSIVELVTVIVVIGILSAIAVVSYNGITAKSRDTSVLSDIDAMDTLQTNYGLKNGVAGKAYYSGTGNGIDADLGFKPSEGNVIDVVIDGSDYCIRGYNTGGSKKTIYDAYTKESSPGVCALLNPSVLATGGASVWSQIAIGYNFTCGLDSSGKAYCWGAKDPYDDNNSNIAGQLGNGTAGPGTSTNTPVAVKSNGALLGLTLKYIASSPDSYYACAIASNNQVYCWGSGDWGPLGNGSDIDSYEPVAVKTAGGALAGLTVKSLHVGSGTNCVIASNDQVYCWGYGYTGLLGNGSSLNSNEPVAVKTAGGALAGLTVKSLSVSADTQHICAIASNNQAYCWGDNSDGQLGSGNSLNSNEPVAVKTAGGALAGLTIKYIKPYSFNTCAIASNNQAYCWGSNMDGQLGDASAVYTISNEPVAVKTTGGALAGLTIKSITMGAFNTCAIASNNLAYCWGGNTSKQLGSGDTLNMNEPTAVYNGVGGVLNGKTIKSIYSSKYYSCVIASDNKAYCWGANDSGQLGNNLIVDVYPATDSYKPQAVNTQGVLNGLTIKSIMVTDGGMYNEPITYAIASDNNIYCWGSNFDNRFGNSTNGGNSFVPVRVNPIP